LPLNPLIKTALNLPKRSGKVRDVYDLGDALLIVSTDRISAFDWILPSGIPNKGRVLTKLSSFWFERLRIENHLLSLELPNRLEIPANAREQLAGRVMVVRKAEVVPFECVVRGYIEGSGWQEYQRSGTICGLRLPPGLRQCDQLAEPIFTPTTKAETGHDQAIDFDSMSNAIGLETAALLRDRSLDVYRQASSYAATKGIIIADTKFEWGWHQGRLLLIDEVLTPDSSRFWPADQYAPGRSQPSYDKQFVREWLLQCGWDRNSPAPELPPNIIEQTSAKYVEAYERISGQRFEAQV
jgi:phosphoribosylaminoimidazole-succinocarboxamide synthase